MTAQTERASLELPGDKSIEVTRDLILDAVKRLPDGDGTRVEADINGRHVEVLPLLMTALHLDPDAIRLRSAADVLRQLGFPSVGDEARDSLAAHNSEQPSLPYDAVEKEPVDLTPDLAIQLQRHSGEWVAVHRGALLAAATNLASLIKSLGDEEASVLFVPDKAGTADHE